MGYRTTLLTRTIAVDAGSVTVEPLISIPSEEFHNFAALRTQAATIAADHARPLVVSCVDEREMAA